jgi:glycosyltransferase EpsH
MPEISIVIPIYNVERYVGECLDSLLAQTFTDYEIICVDDGSIDDSCRIISNYVQSDKRVSLYQQANNGSGAARNLGMNHATGKYIIFLDSDDFFDITMLSKMYKQIIDVDADVCVCEFRIYNQQLKSYEYTAKMNRSTIAEKRVLSHMDVPKTFFGICDPAPWSKLYRRSFIEDKGIHFQETMRANDLSFFLVSMTLANRITFVFEPLVSYRRGHGSTCQSSNDLYQYDWYKALQHAKDKLVSEGVFENIKTSFLSASVNYIIYNLNWTESTNRNHRELFHKIKQEILPELDITQEMLTTLSPESDKAEALRVLLSENYEEYLQYRLGVYKREISRYRVKVQQMEEEKLALNGCMGEKR